jgi:tetratricopeptide (TPR) repeat protein
MKLKNAISIMLFMLFTSSCYGMDAKLFKQMITKIQGREFESVALFLKNNEMQCRQDPDYYVILLSYAIANGEKTSLLVAKGEPQEGDLVVQEQKTGKTVGFIREHSSYNYQSIFEGILKTQRALPNFKSRLDIRFGIVEAAKIIKRWDIMGDQLVEILAISKGINNRWTWGTINSMSSDPESFMLENVQARAAYLFHLENREADDALLRISQAQVKYYPGLVYGYANLGLFYAAHKKYSEAEKYFQQALHIAPNDAIVKENLETMRRSVK